MTFPEVAAWTNADRAKRGEQLLAHLTELYEDDEAETIIGGALTDLLHHCGGSLQIERAAWLARMHHDAETDEESPDI